MTYASQRLKFIIISFVALAIFGYGVQNAAAQTYYPNYASFNRQELVSYLYALIAELQGSPAIATQPVYQYQPVGSVLGAQTGFGRYDIEVTTTGVSNIDDDEAWAFGFVDLNNADSATVYFEYGLSRRDLDERSDNGRIDDRDGGTFRADLEDLDEDEEYYYRAVAIAPDGERFNGQIESFDSDDNGRSNSSRNDDEPDAFTDDADDVDEDSATLRGEVEMNDFRDGLVFFVYGEDEDEIEDAVDEDEYNDIDEQGDDLQKIIVDRNLDHDEDYDADVFGLDDDTEYYFSICVEYEDDDNDETLECGNIEEFETDRD